MTRYLSNMKWILLSLDPLILKVQNWASVLAHYLIPGFSPIMLRMKNGDRLLIPHSYVFEAIAETLLMDVYHFSGEQPEVVVDIGASIGDFSILASSKQQRRVYAFEPDRNTFEFLKKNISLNNRTEIEASNHPADGNVLRGVLTKQRVDHIDFLKIDCEGCEYDVLLKCSDADLSRVMKIAMEIHSSVECRKSDIIMRLRKSGFFISQSKRFGQGHYVYAWRV